MQLCTVHGDSVWIVYLNFDPCWLSHFKLDLKIRRVVAPAQFLLPACAKGASWNNVKCVWFGSLFNLLGFQHFNFCEISFYPCRLCKHQLKHFITLVCNICHENKVKYLSVLPLLGLGKLSCRRKTTFSTKCWMSPVSGPRTNTIQSWVKPSDVIFFLSWARWPNSSFTCTVHWKEADRKKESCTIWDDNRPVDMWNIYMQAKNRLKVNYKGRMRSSRFTEMDILMKM